MNPEPAAFWEASGNLKTYETGTALELRDLSAPSHYNSLAHVFITKVSPPTSVKGFNLWWVPIQLFRLNEVRVGTLSFPQHLRFMMLL